MLRIFKRDLLLCSAITFLVILCALAWGSPFVGTSHSSAVLADSHQAQPAQSMVFQGAVLLTGLQSADAYIGKTVTISGRLESTSNTIHIENIEPGA